MESHPEQTAQAVVQGRGVRDQEDEDDGGGHDLQGAAVEAGAEKLRHRGRVQMLGHDAGPASEDGPGQHGAEQGIHQAHPGGGDAVFPAELSGVADEDDGGEVTRAVCEGGQPGAHGAAAEDEAVDVRRVAPAVDSHGDHDTEEDDEHCDLDKEIHRRFLPSAGSFPGPVYLRTENKNALCRMGRGRA